MAKQTPDINPPMNKDERRKHLGTVSRKTTWRDGVGCVWWDLNDMPDNQWLEYFTVMKLENEN